MVNKTSSFKTKSNGNNADGSRVNGINALMFNSPTFETADFPIQITALPILGRGAALFILRYDAVNKLDMECNFSYNLDMLYTEPFGQMTPQFNFNTPSTDITTCLIHVSEAVSARYCACIIQMLGHNVMPIDVAFADDVTSPCDVTLAYFPQKALRLFDFPELVLIAHHFGEQGDALVDGEIPASLARRPVSNAPRREVNFFLKRLSERQTSPGQRVGCRGVTQQQEEGAREARVRRHSPDDQVGGARVGAARRIPAAAAPAKHAPVLGTLETRPLKPVLDVRGVKG